MEKKPSELWKQYLHEHKSVANAVRDSYKLYEEKYAKHDKENEPEEKFDTKVLVPGKIYSFLYLTNKRPTPEVPESAKLSLNKQLNANEKKPTTEPPKKNRPFIDRRPIFLSMGTVLKDKLVLETGIDLMLVPMQVRPVLLDRVWQYFHTTIEQNEKNLEENRKGRKAPHLNYAVASKIFNKLGWQMAYTGFDRKKMSKITIVDYNDWPAMVPLYTKGIQGKPVKEIYNNYIKRMTNPPEIEL
jgi:hypothetical protein